MASYTTTDLLSSIRQRGSIPTSSNSNNVNNTTNLLALATEELHIELLPLLMSVRAEFYVSRTPCDYSITVDQAEYAIPSRAVGLILRDVQIIDGTNVRSLPEIASEDCDSTATGTPYSYYLQHENVVLYPTPSATTGTLRLRYYVRPSRLAATTDCAQISSIDTATSSVVVNAVPSSWSTGSVVDFVAATVPYQCRSLEAEITNISGTTITFDALPSSLAANDWVALSEYTPIPQVPFEFQPVLAQMTVVKALEALGDNDGVSRAMKNLTTLQENALKLVTPRNHGEPKRVVVRRWR